MPLQLYFFVTKFHPRFTCLEFKKRFGSLFSEINTNKPFAKYNIIIFCLRRAAISVSVIFLKDIFVVQCFFVQFFTFISLWNLLAIKPYTDNLLN
jgi:hypothetical protein